MIRLLRIAMYPVVAVPDSLPQADVATAIDNRMSLRCPSNTRKAPNEGASLYEQFCFDLLTG
jgi:hypothetical protein